MEFKVPTFVRTWFGSLYKWGIRPDFGHSKSEGFKGGGESDFGHPISEIVLGALRAPIVLHFGKGILRKHLGISRGFLGALRAPSSDFGHGKVDLL